VCGSSKDLLLEAKLFCEDLGHALAARQEVTIVCSGTKCAKEENGGQAAALPYSVEWYLTEAAANRMKRLGAAERFETLLAAGDSPERTFKRGAVTLARGKTSEARRIGFALSLDALIAVAGGNGTAQELAIAFEHGIPVLPLPMFGGTAREFWDAYRSEVRASLRLSEAETNRWETAAPSNDLEREALAKDVVEALLSSLRQRCFVIMPFSEQHDPLYDGVITRAIGEVGDDVLRTDRARRAGDAVRQVEEGIANCDYVIVVLDGFRSNVLYELGLAVGQKKPAVLMLRQGALGEEGQLPFDLRSQNILIHADDDSLVPHLVQHIGNLPIKRRPPPLRSSLDEREKP